MKSCFLTIVCLVSLFLCPPSDLSAQVETINEKGDVECADGFRLELNLEMPSKTGNKEMERVIILVPGSGSQSMDVDLTSVTKGKTENLLYKTMSRPIAEQGFAVLRYNKRSFQVRKMIEAAPKAEETQRFKASLIENPLKLFVDDVLALAEYAKKRFPNASIYLLGHSEGTYVSLQAAHQSEDIHGVGLIGFAEYSTDTLAFVQTVYRPLFEFAGLDLDGSEDLDQNELDVETALAKALKSTLPLIDSNQDAKLSRSEFQAANLANLLVQDVFAPFRKQEAEYPRVAEILKSAEFKTIFFQGMLDNQTPAYHAMAIELLLKQLGKMDGKKFNYFSGLGHALDPRDKYHDVEYSPIDPAALAKVAGGLNEFFRDNSDAVRQ